VVTEVASVDEKPINSLAQKSKERAKRLHYSKFTKSKDLSTASQHDLACILGTEKRSKMAKISSADDDTSQNEEETRTGFGSNVFIEGPKQIKSTNESKTENILFSTNPMSIGDYFAQKMKSKLSNSNGSTTEKKIDTIKENELKHKNDEALEGNIFRKFFFEFVFFLKFSKLFSVLEQEEQTSKKKKKSKRKEIEKESISNIEANECEPTEVLKLKKKKKSKLQEPEQEQEEETITSIETNERQAIEISPKREKKSKRKELIVNEACSQIDSESTEIKLKKKKSKLQEAEEAELELEPVVKEDEKGINEKLELSFKGSNVTQLYGYSPYNISCNLDTILSEKAKKADRKRILVEKNLEKNPKFYEMSKKPLITFKHKE